MSKRVFNFGAGPCTLPLSVLEEAQAEFTNYMDSGMSVIEMSHRGKQYDKTHLEAIADTREVFGVPNDFEVIFVQGGATLQFSMIPMNLLNEGEKAAYICSGEWGNKAYEDALIYGNAYKAWDGESINYVRMPENKELKLEPGTRYLHITTNETIGGIRIIDWPKVNVPVVADMSSDFMSRPIPWEIFDLVYGGVQKNLGPSGMAVVFIRKSILEKCNKKLGAYLKYTTHVKSNSLYNTPPVFPIYILGKVMKWMKKQGGLKGIEKMADEKAAIIYDVIDASNGYYRNPMNKAHRSVMNIVFRLPTEELEEKFVKEATGAGMIGLKGHRSVGGCRSSCYNALPKEGALFLAKFMTKFQTQNPA